MCDYFRDCKMKMGNFKTTNISDCLDSIESYRELSMLSPNGTHHLGKQTTTDEQLMTGYCGVVRVKSLFTFRNLPASVLSQYRGERFCH